MNFYTKWIKPRPYTDSKCYYPMTNTKKSWKIFWLGDWLVLNHLPGSVLFPWIWSEASGLENMITVIHTKIIFDCKLTLLGSLKNNICLVMQFLFWFKKTCCFFLSSQAPVVLNPWLWTLARYVTRAIYRHRIAFISDLTELYNHFICLAYMM